MKLVASAIVKNEAGRYLDVWLEHLLGFCDAVVLVDDGSTDDTVKVASRSRVLVFPNDGPSFFEDESAARNTLLSRTYELHPDWVLQIDADEFVGEPAALRNAVEEHQHRARVIRMTMREAWKVSFWPPPDDPGLDATSLGLRVDGQWGDRRTHILWRCPPNANIRSSQWRVRPRRLACGREPLKVRASPSLDMGLHVYHFGWTRQAEREARAARYAEHDQGKFHADKHLQSILWQDDRVGINWIPWPDGIPDEVKILAQRP